METILRHKTPACLWMQAGVVNKKFCKTDYSCTTCKFDRAMKRTCHENQELREKSAGLMPEALKRKKGEFVFWQDKLKMQPLAKRPCIHHMKGHIDFKGCSKAYNCIDCEFDQYFNDQFKVHTVLRPVQFNDIDGVSLPMGYYLHAGHTWLKIEDKNNVRIGIDDFAARLLGEFSAITTPLMGKQLTQGRQAIHIARDENKASFVSPVSGVVMEVNPKVNTDPALINNDPYMDGWILNLYCPDLKKDLKNLMFMESSNKFMGGEVKNLYTFLEEETQLKAADGGAIGSDLYGNLPGVSWEMLLNRFIPQSSE